MFVVIGMLVLLVEKEAHRMVGGLIEHFFSAPSPQRPPQLVQRVSPFLARQTTMQPPDTLEIILSYWPGTGTANERPGSSEDLQTRAKNAFDDIHEHVFQVCNIKAYAVI